MNDEDLKLWRTRERERVELNRVFEDEVRLYCLYRLQKKNKIRRKEIKAKPASDYYTKAHNITCFWFILLLEELYWIGLPSVLCCFDINVLCA